MADLMDHLVGCSADWQQQVFDNYEDALKSLTAQDVKNLFTKVMQYLGRSEKFKCNIKLDDKWISKNLSKEKVDNSRVDIEFQELLKSANKI